MAYELYIRHYDRLGVLKKAILEPLWARYTGSVDGQEPLVFALNYDDPAAADIEEFDIMEVMLRNKELGIQDADGGFVRDFIAIVRDWDIQTDEDGLTFYQFKAPNEKHILSWRSVLWYTGFADRSTFANVPAETIMKTLIQYNFTSDASKANGRWREGDLLAGMGIDITIIADLARGINRSAAFMGGNILPILQGLAGQGGGDFSLEWQGGNEWEFEFHEGQLGDDKSAGSERVLFSIKNNSMRNPKLSRISAAATVAISAGQKEGVDRETSEVEGPDYAADCDIEEFVDARRETTEEGRIYRGLVRLEALRKIEKLSFDVLQTADQFYSPINITGRKTYRAGDLVLAFYGGSEQVRKIEQVFIEWKVPNNEDAFQVSISTSEVVYAGS